MFIRRLSCDLPQMFLVFLIGFRQEFGMQIIIILFVLLVLSENLRTVGIVLMIQINLDQGINLYIETFTLVFMTIMLSLAQR